MQHCSVRCREPYLQKTDNYFETDEGVLHQVYKCVECKKYYIQTFQEVDFDMVSQRWDVVESELKKNIMCDFCSDWRCVQPAHAISLRDDEGNMDSWVQEMRDKKRFLQSIYEDGKVNALQAIESCPKCGYVFTSEDYDYCKDT